MNKAFRNPSNSPNICLCVREEKGIQVCRDLAKDGGVRGMRGAGGRGGARGFQVWKTPGKNSAYLGLWKVV